MDKAVLSFFIAIGIITLFVFTVYSCTGAEANRLDAQARAAIAEGRSRAMIIEAQGQSRLDSAQATSLLMVASLPYLVATVGVIALTLLALCVVGIFILAVKHRPVRIERIETKIMYLPAPQASRREVWQMMSAGAEVQPMVIEGSKRK